MDFSFWLSLSLTLVLFAVGLILTILPVFPGPVLVLAGVSLFHFWTPESSPGLLFLLFSLALVLLSLGLDILLSILGARRFGATWKGAVGALVGGVVGIFIPPPLVWIFIGPMVGAVLGEILGGRQFRAAGRAGWGTFLGTMVAMAAKLGVSVFIIVGFLISLVTGIRFS